MGGCVLKNKGKEKQEHDVQKGWGVGEGERMLQLEAGIELIPNQNICFCFIRSPSKKKDPHSIVSCSFICFLQ